MIMKAATLSCLAVLGTMGCASAPSSRPLAPNASSHGNPSVSSGNGGPSAGAQNGAARGHTAVSSDVSPSAPKNDETQSPASPSSVQKYRRPSDETPINSGAGSAIPLAH
jgi:hypothetical protein